MFDRISEYISIKCLKLYSVTNISQLPNLVKGVFTILSPHLWDNFFLKTVNRDSLDYFRKKAPPITNVGYGSKYTSLGTDFIRSFMKEFPIIQKPVPIMKELNVKF